MAPDSWHHLEGVHPAARVFRLYVYDDYGRPLAAAKVKDVEARVVTKENFDPATRKTTELSAFPLKPARNRPYLEARIDPATLPAEMTAKVRFGDDQPEYRFDFTFASLSKEPAAPTVRPSVTQPLSAPGSPAVAPAPSAETNPLTPLPIPTSMSGMLEPNCARGKNRWAISSPVVLQPSGSRRSRPRTSRSRSSRTSVTWRRSGAMRASRRWRESCARRGSSMHPATLGTGPRSKLCSTFKAAVGDARWSHLVRRDSGTAYRAALSRRRTRGDRARAERRAGRRTQAITSPYSYATTSSQSFVTAADAVT
jgi:hypothetical protein